VAAVCDICAKKPGFGNNRPWSRKMLSELSEWGTGCLVGGSFIM
jgi:hypothetical protein